MIATLPPGDTPTVVVVVAELHAAVASAATPASTVKQKRKIRIMEWEALEFPRKMAGARPFRIADRRVNGATTDLEHRHGEERSQ